MSDQLAQLSKDLETALDDLQAAASLQEGDIVVVGTSTSEVKGEHIGKAGSMEVAEQLWSALNAFRLKTGVHLAFQCCEHLNRALVIEANTARHWRLEDTVSVIPMPKAGGSMASFAYRHMESPVVLETIRAHAGIDIGDTLIGMHLKQVAVPVRSSVKSIGSAHLTLARTRPKLIGGERAVYTIDTTSTPDTCE